MDIDFIDNQKKFQWNSNRNEILNNFDGNFDNTNY